MKEKFPFDDAYLLEGLGHGLGERPHGVGLSLLVHDGGASGQAFRTEPKLTSQIVVHDVV